MTLVVDASAAIKWIVDEPGRAEALQRAAGQELVAPEFALVEAANILWKKVRLKQLSPKQAHAGLAFIRDAYGRLVPTGVLITEALDLAIRFDHPVYDCLYLSCAHREGAALLTADRRLANKVGAEQSTKFIVLQETTQ